MKDKHFLLNSWPFFQEHINEMVSELQNKATEVYSKEQNICSQRALRLSCSDQKYSPARSLIKLTNCTNVFAQLHLWFTWLLSTGAKRLEEHLPTQTTDSRLLNEGKNWTQEKITLLKEFREKLGAHDFRRVLHSLLIGRQVIVRGPRIIVGHVINLFKLFLPLPKFRCQEFGEIYQSPECCNIVGLDLYAAVPKSCDKIMRLDIVLFQEIGSKLLMTSLCEHYHFIVKNESLLPEKLPSLLVKVDKALADKNLSESVVSIHLKCLMEQWLHAVEVIRETKKQPHELYQMGLMQCLGIQEQDSELIKFWTS